MIYYCLQSKTISPDIHVQGMETNAINKNTKKRKRGINKFVIDYCTTLNEQHCVAIFVIRASNKSTGWKTR